MGIEVNVKFTNEQIKFCGGEKVSGTVEIIVPPLENTKVYKTKEISIQIEGKAKWLISEGKTTAREDNTFFIDVHQVFGDGQLSIALENRTYTYQFSTILPPNIPSSYKSSVGEIYYQVVVIIQRDLLWNRKTKVPFEVQGILDVRKLEFSTIPVEITGQKSICCLCCMAGNIRFVLRMPRDKVLTNEILPFTLMVENQSSRRIRAIRVQLFQVIKFTYRGGTTKQRNESQVLAETSWIAVEPRCIESWSDGKLQIPNDLAPTNDISLLIRTEYFLRVTAEVQGCSTNLTKDVPLVIGHLPQPSNGYEPFEGFM